MLSASSARTSDTESTTAPMTRPRTFSTMTTVKSVYSAVSQANFRRRLTMGTITPRRLTTPLMKCGALLGRNLVGTVKSLSGLAFQGRAGLHGTT